MSEASENLERLKFLNGIVLNINGVFITRQTVLDTLAALQDQQETGALNNLARFFRGPKMFTPETIANVIVESLNAGFDFTAPSNFAEEIEFNLDQMLLRDLVFAKDENQPPHYGLRPDGRAFLTYGNEGKGVWDKAISKENQ